MRIPLHRKQADYLTELRVLAQQADQRFQTALAALALAAGDNGDVAYDLGADPWIEVTEKPSGDQ